VTPNRLFNPSGDSESTHRSVMPNPTRKMKFEWNIREKNLDLTAWPERWAQQRAKAEE